MSEIKNRVKEYKNILVSEFLSYEFNDLKSKDRDVSSLKNIIKKKGFTSPIMVANLPDKKYVLDGTGREKAVSELIQEGYTFNSIPAVYIEAETIEEAKQTVLELNSRYGDITIDSLGNFMEGYDFDMEDIKIPDIDIDSLIDDEVEEEEKPEIEFSDELLLEHNYVVLYFDNPFDWEVAKEKFGLKEVKSVVPEGSQKVGTGRVINGAKFLEKYD